MLSIDIYVDSLGEMKFVSNVAVGYIIDYIVNPIFSSHITPSSCIRYVYIDRRKMYKTSGFFCCCCCCCFRLKILFHLTIMQVNVEKKITMRSIFLHLKYHICNKLIS